MEERIGWIYLNRPERRNALNVQMLRDLNRRLVEARESREVRVIVLTGRGKAFSAGMDLGEVAQFQGYQDAYRLFYEGLYGVTKAMIECEKPVIISVNGPAIGGSVELLYAGDIIIVAKSAYFQMVEARWGIVAPASATVGIKILGPRLAYYLLTCERISSEDALRLGLVDVVVDDEKLYDKTRDVAGSIARNHPGAVSETKRMISRYKMLEELELGYLSVSKWASEKHFIEAAKAFIKDKKLPKWS